MGPDVPLPRAKLKCPTFSVGVIVGKIRSDAIDETSGVVASRKQANVLWVHNDSGGGAFLYAISPQGDLLATYEIDGVSAFDWEGITIGPGPDKQHDYLYIGDIGDNLKIRPSVAIHRIVEPSIPATPSSSTTPISVTDAVSFSIEFPDDSEDSEALLMDPHRGEMLIITKDKSFGYSKFYTLNFADELDPTEPLHPQYVMTLRFSVEPFAGSGTLVTAGDVSPSGDELILRTNRKAYLWPRYVNESFKDTFSRPPCPFPVARERQGEAIAFSSDGSSVYTVSEGKNQPIYVYHRRN